MLDVQFEVLITTYHKHSKLCHDKLKYPGTVTHFLKLVQIVLKFLEELT